MIRTLLIANRGEIACRIQRTAKRLGLRTVAVYSRADANALHTLMADEAIAIGDNAPADSYLDIDKVIGAAIASGADAIHPGYGFLSENAAFAARCAEAELIFVGPPAAAIEAMGSKARSKQIMQQAGVPLLPGYHDEDDDTALADAANTMGYPVLLKASAGGGGKGMRIAHTAADFERELAAARREALAAFGDDRMLVEKFLTEPRHVEVQVFADQHGETVHLFDRDCSVQRRHQKVLEEAPAPNIDATVRDAMWQAAIEAAKAIDYVGAGTVEFLLDGDQFYFMEMNTRLQVEHPVTEAVTGIDLVEWQLRIASGESLPLLQADIACTGSAVEARIYAEDPAADYLPQTGLIHQFEQPQERPGLRIDTGVRSGDEISIYYDPMIAKMVGYGRNRAQALARLHNGLSECLLDGPKTNLGLLQNVVDHQAFRDAELSTQFLNHHDNLADSPEPTDADFICAAVVVSHAQTTSLSIWQQSANWRMNLPAHWRAEIQLGESRQTVTLCYRRDKTLPYAATVDQNSHELDLVMHEHELLLSLKGHRHRYRYLRHELTGVLSSAGGRFHFSLPAIDLGDDDTKASGALTAPMTGRVVQIGVSVGDTVAQGDVVAVIEAMKMEHSLLAPFDGIVKACHAAADQLVDGGHPLIIIEPNKEIQDQDDAGL
ncbi:MAG: biotin carboxylase N-terminal domain-containing protein [Pseudomonadota bacterium]